jgi:hypothetical protein
MTYLCVTCGTQFSPADHPPERCPICQDERQFVGLQGQQWTTLEKLQKSHRNTIYQEDEGIWGVLTVPQFGIGQRALLMRTAQGNILWDCVSLINPDTVELIKALGGISAIAISHPHYYTSMVEWSRAFGGVPIYLHEEDREWVQRPDPVIRFWKGETYPLGQGLTLIRLGGHFPGFQVLHSAQAENGRGAPGLASWCKETPRRPCVVRRIATCGHSKALHLSRIESPPIGSCYTNASFRGEKFPRFGNTFVSESSATPNQDARVAPY